MKKLQTTPIRLFYCQVLYCRENKLYLLEAMPSSPLSKRSNGVRCLVGWLPRPFECEAVSQIRVSIVNNQFNRQECLMKMSFIVLERCFAMCNTVFNYDASFPFDQFPILERCQKLCLNIFPFGTNEFCMVPS